MSGHSKWHSIRRSKGILDQKRGQLFTKLARDITIATATDTRNRTNTEVRTALSKAGGNPGEPGSVGWMFEQKGLITIDLAARKLDADDVMLTAIDAGADDVEVGDDVIEVYTEFQKLAAVREALLSAGMPLAGAEKTMLAKTTIQPDETDALKALKLIERLEDLDDVQKVYSNLDISEELVEQFANQ